MFWILIVARGCLGVIIHTGRHTFATTVTLEKGVSLESVANMLGHASTRTTEDYSKVTEVKIATETKNIFK